jgi:hypothetical protein
MNEFLWLFSQESQSGRRDRAAQSSGGSFAVAFALGCIAIAAAIKLGGFDPTLAFAGLVQKVLG